MTEHFLLQVFVWIFIIYGITQIVVEAQIFAWLRDGLATSRIIFFRWLSYLVKCFLCSSVWVSFILGYLVFSPTAVFWPLTAFQNAFLDAMFGSALVWFMHIMEFKGNK